VRLVRWLTEGTLDSYSLLSVELCCENVHECNVKSLMAVDKLFEELITESYTIYPTVTNA
jgi:hypothetical protein